MPGFDPQRRAMRQLLLASCLLASTSPAFAATTLSHRPGQLFTPADWQAVGNYTYGEGDVVVLSTGHKLVGELAVLPAVDYSFGTVSFNPSEVALIAFVEADGAPKIQIITRDGRNFIGDRPEGKVTFLERSPSGSGQGYEERSLDPSVVSFIALQARPGAAPVSSDRFYQLTLQNGDQLFASLDRQILGLTNGWQDRSISSDRIVDISFNGGIQGTIEGPEGEQELGFAFLKDPFLYLNLNHSAHSIHLPWEQIAQVKVDMGEYYPDSRPSQVLTDVYYPSVRDEPLMESAIAAVDRPARREPTISTWVSRQPAPAPSEPVISVDETASVTVLTAELPVTIAKPRPNKYESMVKVAGGQFYVSVGDNVAAAHQGNLLPTAHKPSFVIEVAPFYVDEHEVTNAQYEAFVKATDYSIPSHWVEGQIPAGQQHQPVTNVSYQDAAAYASWAGKRLPNEIEWQRASDEASALVAKEVERKKNTLNDQAFSILSLFAGFEPVMASEEDVANAAIGHLMDPVGSRVAEWTSSSAVAGSSSPLANVAGLYHSNAPQYQGHRIVRQGFVQADQPPEFRSTLHQAETNERTGFRCVADIR